MYGVFNMRFDFVSSEVLVVRMLASQGHPKAMIGLTLHKMFNLLRKEGQFGSKDVFCTLELQFEYVYTQDAFEV